ncbi:uncharacterized protein LOC142604583 [Balearica regulorum gibbericeps]|uniref:uncharacterized protein LOC142604583 n=1 Tax=Balearica regulorum gibbericeps TaxID=100784 RepID=UPI003F61C009
MDLPLTRIKGSRRGGTGARRMGAPQPAPSPAPPGHTGRPPAQGKRLAGGRRSRDTGGFGTAGAAMGTHRGQGCLTEEPSLNHHRMEVAATTHPTEVVQEPDPDVPRSLFLLFSASFPPSWGSSDAPGAEGDAGAAGSPVLPRGWGLPSRSRPHTGTGTLLRAPHPRRGSGLSRTHASLRALPARDGFCGTLPVPGGSGAPGTAEGLRREVRSREKRRGQAAGLRPRPPGSQPGSGGGRPGSRNRRGPGPSRSARAAVESEPAVPSAPPGLGGGRRLPQRSPGAAAPRSPPGPGGAREAPGRGPAQAERRRPPAPGPARPGPARRTKSPGPPPPYRRSAPRCGGGGGRHQSRREPWKGAGTGDKSSQFATVGYNSPMARHERSDPRFLLTPNTLWKWWGVPNKEKNPWPSLNSPVLQRHESPYGSLIAVVQLYVVS